MAGSGHERSTSGGRRAMMDRPRGNGGPGPFRQNRCQRIPSITRTPAGQNIITTAEVIRHTCIPMGVSVLCRRRENARPRPGPPDKTQPSPDSGTDQAPAQATPDQTQLDQPRPSRQASGQEKLPYFGLYQNGVYWNYICETENYL